MSSGPKALEDIVVGDRFWLEYARGLVEAAVTAPVQRAAQLEALIAWFWSVYSAAGLIALSLGAVTFSKLLVGLIFLPSIVLVLAYWFASRVRRPLPVEFDPRVPI